MTQRILVVDDDKQIVRLVRAYLEQAGFQVFTAYDGGTALHIIRRERPDLVVLDLMLPDQDCWDITRIVRSDPALAELTGLEPADLYAELQEGKTLLEVAQAHGVSAEQLVEAALAARAEVLQQRVEAGYLTQEDRKSVV